MTAARRLAGVLRTGGCVYACGNGGSASQASHFVAELVGRMDRERAPLRAVALTDAAVLTAIANDYGVDEMFARQVRALVCRADALVCFSTSGTSANVVAAMRAAQAAGAYALLMTGVDAAAHGMNVMRANAHGTRAIQEAHVALAHELVQAIEEHLQ